MSLPLTPARLAAVYESLRVFPPFNRLSLPPADGVEFTVARRRDVYGLFTHWSTGRLEITVSAATNDSLIAVAQVMAHEMIHLAQAVRKTSRGGHHNAEFNRIAARACRVFGWDVKRFA